MFTIGKFYSIIWTPSRKCIGVFLFYRLHEAVSPVEDTYFFIFQNFQLSNDRWIDSKQFPRKKKADQNKRTAK